MRILASVRIALLVAVSWVAVAAVLEEPAQAGHHHKHVAVGVCCPVPLHYRAFAPFVFQGIQPQYAGYSWYLAAPATTYGAPLGCATCGAAH